MATLHLVKKPTEVEGVLYNGQNQDECAAFCQGAWYQGEGGTCFIKTLEGDHEVKEGAMVVKGTHGEFYPVDPAIIQDTFTMADGQPVTTIAASTEAIWNAKQREAAPDSDWAMPRLKKLRISDAKHSKLAWDMVDRVAGATDDDRAQARHRILAAAKKFGVDTSQWNKGRKSLEDYVAGYKQAIDRNFIMDALPYLFNQLSEEASELGQAACKTVRFGIDSVDPFNQVSNRDKLREEYTDVQVVLKLIEEELYSRGYTPLLTGSGGAYYQERLVKRIASLKQEYTDGRFMLPGEYADQQA